MPKLKTPFKVYIYCTLPRKSGDSFLVGGKHPVQGNGKVIGEFICDEIERVDIPYPAYQDKLDKRYIEQSCVPYNALHRYCYHDDAYFWHISNLKIYDEPKMLRHFFKPCGNCDKKGSKRCTEELTYCRAKTITRPPQSWCYVEEREENDR